MQALAAPVVRVSLGIRVVATPVAARGACRRRSLAAAANQAPEPALAVAPRHDQVGDAKRDHDGEGDGQRVERTYGFDEEATVVLGDEADEGNDDEQQHDAACDGELLSDAALRYRFVKKLFRWIRLSAGDDDAHSDEKQQERPLHIDLPVTAGPGGHRWDVQERKEANERGEQPRLGTQQPPRQRCAEDSDAREQQAMAGGG